MLAAASSVGTASIADVDGPLLDAMASPAVGCASINGMLVVETPTGRVQLDQLITHGSSLWRFANCRLQTSGLGERQATNSLDSGLFPGSEQPPFCRWQMGAGGSGRKRSSRVAVSKAGTETMATPPARQGKRTRRKAEEGGPSLQKRCSKRAMASWIMKLAETEAIQAKTDEASQPYRHGNGSLEQARLRWVGWACAARSTKLSSRLVPRVSTRPRKSTLKACLEA